MSPVPYRKYSRCTISAGVRSTHHHCVRFARSGLTVGKDGTVVTVHDIFKAEVDKERGKFVSIVYKLLPRRDMIVALA